MKYLLDTNVFINLNISQNQISSRQKSILDDPANEFYMSVASIYEMAIKVRLGKLVFAYPLAYIVGTVRKRLKIKLLPVTEAYSLGILQVERLPDHGDPFDLLILSQAKSLKMPVLTSDSKFPSYRGVTAII